MKPNLLKYKRQLPNRNRLVASGSCRLLCAMLIVLPVLMTGCVERSLTIRSAGDTPLQVYLDGQYSGTTPYTTDFIAYGRREVMLEDETGRRIIQTIDLNCPWYDFFPLDLFSAVLYPGTIRNELEYILDIPSAFPIDLMAVEERALAFKQDFQEEFHAD